MRFLCILLLSSFPFLSFASTSCKAVQEQYGLSDDQVGEMHQSFLYAESEGLGSVLAAISFYESSAGVFLVGADEVSAGSHHVLITHVINTFELPHTKENRAFVRDALVNNFGLSAHIALRELKWWHDRHSGDLFKALRSYNQGYYWKSNNMEARKASYKYAQNVTNLSAFVKRHCSWG